MLCLSVCKEGTDAEPLVVFVCCYAAEKRKDLRERDRKCTGKLLSSFGDDVLVELCDVIAETTEDDAGHFRFGFPQGRKYGLMGVKIVAEERDRAASDSIGSADGSPSSMP